ncbi:hypothetical protein B0H10DRAFT_2389761 [Mycena sp. CBHHK59/15]|nr:hypothetical protein B0H10DRAFT_2389761 [Mycena sp. CBHHK59/15]
MCCRKGRQPDNHRRRTFIKRVIVGRHVKPVPIPTMIPLRDKIQGFLARKYQLTGGDVWLLGSRMASDPETNEKNFFFSRAFPIWQCRNGRSRVRFRVPAAFRRRTESGSASPHRVSDIKIYREVALGIRAKLLRLTPEPGFGSDFSATRKAERRPNNHDVYGWWPSNPDLVQLPCKHPYTPGPTDLDINSPDARNSNKNATEKAAATGRNRTRNGSRCKTFSRFHGIKQTAGNRLLLRFHLVRHLLVSHPQRSHSLRAGHLCLNHRKMRTNTFTLVLLFALPLHPKLLGNIATLPVLTSKRRSTVMIKEMAFRYWQATPQSTQESRHNRHNSENIAGEAREDRGVRIGGGGSGVFAS